MLLVILHNDIRYDLTNKNIIMKELIEKFKQILKKICILNANSYPHNCNITEYRMEWLQIDWKNNKIENKTKFKPNFPDEYLKFGVYFKSGNDITTQYLIELCKGRFEGSALVKIYTTGILDNIFPTDGLINGCVIGVPECMTEWIAEVDLCGKYFFPKFNNELQLYYDNEKYYKGNYKSNSVTSLLEAVNFAIEYGLTQRGIVPY